MKHVITLLVLVALPAVGADKQPRTRYAVRVTTDHYVVWADGDRDLATTVGRHAEELFSDFFETFAHSREPWSPTNKLPIVCLDNPLGDPTARQAPRLLPPGYDSWSGVVPLTIDRTPGPSNRTAARVRNAAARQLLELAPDITAFYRLPFWCQNGLPCYFEGAGRFRLTPNIHVTHLRVLRVLYAREPIPDLSDTLTLDPQTPDRQSLPLSQARTWSMCHFLLHGNSGKHRKAFLTFLHAVTEPGKAGDIEGLFRRLVGDPQTLQPKWVRHIYHVSHATAERLAATLKPIGEKPHQERSDEERGLCPTADLGLPFRESIIRPATEEEVAGAQAILEAALKKTGGERIAAIREGFAAVPHPMVALRTCLRSGRRQSRALAAEALALLDLRLPIPRLMDCTLEDPDAGVRRACAEAIRKLNYGMAPWFFYDELTRTTIEKAQMMTDALVVIRDPYAVDALVASLRDLRAGRQKPGKRPHPRSRALEAIIADGLGRLLPDAGARTPDDWLKWADKRIDQ